MWFLIKSVSHFLGFSKQILLLSLGIFLYTLSELIIVFHVYEKFGPGAMAIIYLLFAQLLSAYVARKKIMVVVPILLALLMGFLV